MWIRGFLVLLFLALDIPFAVVTKLGDFRISRGGLVVDLAWGTMSRFLKQT